MAGWVYRVIQQVRNVSAVEKDGKFWGVVYADGHGTSYGWGPIESAHFFDRKYVRKPENITHESNTRNVVELRQGRILDVQITTIYEISG